MAGKINRWPTLAFLDLRYWYNTLVGIDNKNYSTTGTLGAGVSTLSSLKIPQVGGTAGKYNIFQGGANTTDLTYTLPTAYPAVSGYVLSSTTGGVMSWAAGGGGSVSFGTTTQIPYMNAGGTDFLYSSVFKFDGTAMTMTKAYSFQQSAFTINWIDALSNVRTILQVWPNSNGGALVLGDPANGYYGRIDFGQYNSVSGQANGEIAINVRNTAGNGSVEALNIGHGDYPYVGFYGIIADTVQAAHLTNIGSGVLLNDNLLLNDGDITDNYTNKILNRDRQLVADNGSTTMINFKTSGHLNVSNLPQGAGSAPGGLNTGDLWWDTLTNLINIQP